MPHSLILKNFIKLVPEVEDRSQLATVLELFHSGDEEMVVVVTKERSPLGFFDYRRLLKIILKEKKINLSPSLELSSIIEPIQSISALWSVKQFGDYLKSQHQSWAEGYFALVDEKGKFLGILDQGKLVKTLVEDKQPQTLLEQLLQMIPLPLMWQDRFGKTLGQNVEWRLLLGDYVPNEQVSQVKLKPPRAYQRALLANQGDRDHLPYCLKDNYKLATNIGDSILSELLQDLPRGTTLTTSPHYLESTSTPQHEEITIPKERVWQFERVMIDSLVPSVFYLIIATDITEEQRLGTEVATKNADLLHLNRLKDEFLSCISHELKSPLTAILGLSSLLKDQKLGELNGRQARYSELIYQSGRQLMTLVNDLLDLTRLETGQLKLTLEPVNIQTVSDRVYQGLKDKHKEKITHELEYSLEIEPNLITLMADETRLCQMLSHLLDNAIKFTPEGGSISLKVSRWDNWIAFTVKDNGIAIPIESQHLLFEKFQQLENPLTRQFEGTGLGLVLTQRLARVHGGDISFISQQGVGSEFTILLPNTLDKLEKTDNLPTEGNNQLILIVETIPRYIERLTSQLEELNYRFVIARTGTEAVNKARQLQPVTILVNPLLPLLSGWDVLTLLKSNPHTQHIPIIITSNPEDKQKALQQGAQGFLSLPIEKQGLELMLSDRANVFQQEIKKLTILYLHPNFLEGNQATVELGFASQISGLIYRFLEADDLEQAELLAKFWQIDVVLFDGSSLSDPLTTLKSFSKSADLASVPLVTLDIKATEAANQISNLSVFPCLVPLKENTLESLLKVIQIAVGID